jgi:hypothetical protein
MVAQAPQEKLHRFSLELTLDNGLGMWYPIATHSVFAEGERMDEQMRFTVDLTKSLYRRFKQKAFDHELPMTEVARRLIQAWLDGEVSIEEEPPSDE